MQPYENFKPEDLVIQTYITKQSGGFNPHCIPHGVRVVHLPTGTVVSCDSGVSQHRNRHLALTELWQKVQGMPSYAELKAQVEQYREIARQYTELAAKGIYYTLDELKTRDAEIKAQAVEAEYKNLLHVVANQYDGNGGSDWAIGANHVFVLFAKEVNKRANQLRQQVKGGVMNKERIRELALANGFKLKEQPDGAMDLNPYVFEFAAALERVATAELKAQVEKLCETVINLEGHRSRHKDSNMDGYCYRYFEVQRVISLANQLRQQAKEQQNDN